MKQGECMETNRLLCINIFNMSGDCVYSLHYPDDSFKIELSKGKYLVFKNFQCGDYAVESLEINEL
ncbi:MAG: hypothetical protein MI866_22015 [Bacteroidales bacterium]|nr:hypothetical protein [Bacteroidales bacterium]